MGTVYRALDLERREEVALKRLRLRADSEGNRRRLLAFEREYQALAQLHHPSIVAAYDYGVDRLGAYYTMELLSGASLHEHGERGADWRKLCSWLRDIASALAVLHARRLVHRDVTPRNIHVTLAGRAKLIDFGALSSADRIAPIVGTPPFLPPEATQGLPLDARSDLYALGATAYWVLAGTHAYPAKHIAELEQLWRVTPPALHTLHEPVPNALSELVMALMSLDRSGRPSGADHVIERLTAIAGLPAEDARSVGSSYVVRPGYVGRNAQLREVRRRGLQALRGRGSVLLASGMPGSGHTRYLEECALEAKLLGMSVYKVASHAALDAAATAKMIVSEARMRASAALWAVEAIDAERAEALTDALIAQGLPGQRALVVIAKTAPGSVGRSEPHASEVDLPPLNVLQTRTLLASMFGVGVGLESLAATLHGLSRGNVRALIDLSRALVSSGTVRCEAGTWLFPERIDEAQIGQLARMALGDELARLDEAAPEIQLAAFALALTPSRWLTQASLISVVPELEALPLEALCSQLAPLGVVLDPPRSPTAGPRLRLIDQAWAKLLSQSVPDHIAPCMNARLATIAERSGLRSQAIVHRWRAGQIPAATALVIEHSEPVFKGTVETDTHLPTSSFFRALTACSIAAEQNGLSPRERAIVDSMRFLHDMAGEHVTKAELQRVVKRLAHDCGLTDYDLLDPALPQEQRMFKAFEIATRRHAAAPPGGDDTALFPPSEALRGLARVVLGACTIAVVSLDTEWLRLLPSLEPYLGFAPALWVVDETVRASNDCLEGRYLRARERYIAIVERMDQPDKAGLSGSGHYYTRLGLIHGIGFIEGQLGMQSALGHIELLRNDPHLSISAWHLQGTFHFMQGDTDQANACRERAELLNASLGVLAFYPGTSLVAELLACGLADDLIGLKRAADRVAPLVARHIGWKTVLVAAQVEYARVRGDLPAALELLRVTPHRELRMQQAPGSEILALAAARTLLAADRLDEAYEIAHRLYTLAEATGMLIAPIAITLALIEARRGDMAAAIERTENMIRMARELGCKGLPLGRAHETRATLACLAGDAEQLRQSARACAEEYARGHNPVLHALYQGLLTRARRAGFPTDHELTAAHNDTRATPEAVEAELNDSACEHELAERALSHVVARSGARDGFLYLRDFRATGAVRRVAARGTPSPLIDAHALHVLSGTTEEVTVSVADDDGVAGGTLGYEHETLVLGRDEVAPTAIGVIVLVDSHRHGSPATLELLPALTRSCARRSFNGSCKHDTAVLLEERVPERSFLKGAS